MKCKTCGTTISGSYLQMKTGLFSKDYYCDQQCADASLPLCDACSTPMKEWVEMSGNKYCSEECSKDAYPLCDACSTPMKEWIKKYGNKYCSEECSKEGRPICENCSVQMDSYSKHKGKKFCSDKCLTEYKELHDTPSFLDKAADTLTSVGSTFVEHAQKQQARQMKDYSRRAASQGKEPKVGGKTLREWEGSWDSIGSLSSASLSSFSDVVGLYRARLGGKVVYVGRAIEYSNGGLRKRLSDYTRDSDSARKHKSGQLMNQHASELNIDVLIIGSDSDAVNVAKKLEKYFIGKHSPEWNKMLK